MIAGSAPPYESGLNLHVMALSWLLLRSRFATTLWARNNSDGGSMFVFSSRNSLPGWSYALPLNVAYDTHATEFRSDSLKISLF